MHLANFLKELRACRGMSYAKLSAATGITRAHLYNLETGRATNPTVATLVHLGAALGVSAAELCRVSVRDQ